MSELAPGSLVLYKQRPARVEAVADKIAIRLDNGTDKKVRPKDVTLLHPGPVADLGGLDVAGGDIEGAREVLSGETANLADLADLAWGEFTPATAWSAWQVVADGLYFSGTPEAVTANDDDFVAAERQRRAEKAEAEAAWSGLIGRLRDGRYADEDAGALAEVERVALGASTHSRILRELGRAEEPEAAHRLLAQIGYWSPIFNPHPRRLDANLTTPDLTVPALLDEDRVDLTHLDAFAIDDAGNQDPDDAISVDGDRLWVHVADVAALVPPDSELDLEARGRGATLYLPEGVTPMLPPSMIGELGLGLQPVSPALSFGLRLGDDGSVTDVEVVPSRVAVTRLSYAEAEERLDEPAFAAIRRFTDRFRERRRAGGAAFIQLPEVSVKLVDGEVVIRDLPALASRQMVTEAMLMAGEGAALFAATEGLAFPFATQPPPERREDGAGMAAAFAFRRLMKPSRIQSAPELHAGLGLPAYSQATSPLRRYMDLVVHQQLRAHLRGETPLDTEAVVERIGAVQGLMGTLRRSERLSNQHWKLVHLQGRPDWRGRGVVVEKQEGRGKVLIPELALEAKMSLPRNAELDAELDLHLTGVDLPALEARFRAS